MADDEDIIYVDVAARLDEASAEKATGKLRDKFKNASKGLGKALGSDITREIGEMLWDAGGDEVKKAGVQWGKSLTKSLGDSIGGSLGGVVKSVGDAVLESSADSISDSIKNKLKGVKDSVDDVKHAFSDLKDGKYEDVLKRIDENAEKLPDPLKKIHDQTKPISDAFNDIKSTGKDVIDAFAGLEIIAPRLASGLAQVAAPLGEIAGAMAMVPKIDDWLKSHFPSLPLPDTNDFNWLKQPFREMGGDIMHPSRLGQGGLYDQNGNYIGPGSGAPPKGKSYWPGFGSQQQLPPGLTTPGAPPPSTGAPPPLGGIQSFLGGPQASPPPGAPSDMPAHTSSAITGGGGTHVSLVDFTTPSTPDVGSPSDLPAAGAGVANLFRFAQSLVGTPYSQKLRNDCSGMVSRIASVAVGMGDQGAQFDTTSEGAWLAAHGFQPGLGGPQDLNIGWNPLPGNQGHTAATLPGGVNAEQGGSHGAFALGAGAAGATDPYFTQHAHFSMGGGRGGAAFRGAGFGIPGLPGQPGVGAVPPPPTQGNTYTPMQQPGLGHGSGLGVSGGAIGLAEQAGAMAAGAMSFGGGAIAAQIAEQEMNLAIQKGGQMAAVAAMAPVETFGLAGGQMGAPSVAQGGWYKKIVGGLIGQQTNIPNVAGGTQPPKQPKQGEEGNPDDAAKGGQPGGGGGPKGSQDDPMHVKVTNTPPPPPQGTATSAMNTGGVMSAITA